MSMLGTSIDQFNLVFVLWMVILNDCLIIPRGRDAHGSRPLLDPPQARPYF